jgi:helicase
MAFKGLFIGIDRYNSAEINWLSCANRDATALHALFSDTLGGETTLLTKKYDFKSRASGSFATRAGKQVFSSPPHREGAH